MIKGHGNDGYLFDTKIVADFSSNVNYQGISEEFKNYLQQHVHAITEYPQSNAENLRDALAHSHKLPSDHLLVTNGATEGFYLIAQTFRATTATVIIPSFAEYEDACLINHIHVQHLAWADVSEYTTFNTKLVFFGNPNNPHGKFISRTWVERWIKIHPETLFIIDEAYIDFVRDDISFNYLLTAFENLILVKSLTKTYSIPGLRLGYLLSSPGIIQKIQHYKMPWSVNSLAIAAGLYIAEHGRKKSFPLERLLADTQDLISSLNTIKHIHAAETCTHFFLCKTQKGTAADLKHFLIKVYGILIRDAGNFKSLSPQHFRIATQTKEKNDLLINGIRAWVNNF